ncbi:MAG TPA: EAL domain-containing protein [Acidimicrobiia bacterium]|nr:EAL domain-containing protein [Acidimicrobiia bacterium]
MEAPAPAANPGAVSPWLVHGVEAAALGFLLLLRHLGVIAHQPWWAYALVIAGSSAINRRLDADAWMRAERGTWKLHVRVLAHALTVAVVIYMTGWGPALVVCFVYTAMIDLQQSGSATWRAVLGWSLVCVALGQSFVALGWAPTLLDEAAEWVTLGFLGAFACTIVIVMAGRIGEAKERAEHLLTLATEDAERREALHRAVIENAAEGIYTIDSDGNVLSFNAAAEAIFGWTASEMVGRPGSLMLGEDLRYLLDEYLVTVRTLGYDAAPHGTFEVPGLRRDGTRFPMVISTSAVVVEGAEPMTCCLVRDLSEQKQLEGQLSHQALHDFLTGLPNRTMLTDRLDQALARSRRHHGLCGVLYVDLDRFKTVNDTLGHAGGDALLKEAARRIVISVREADTVARLGGDEFVIICEDLTGVHDAVEVTERVAAALRAPYAISGDRVHANASIGIALSAGGQDDADALIANADIAMYRAKQNGRDRYELFDEAMQTWVTKQNALEHDLRRALARNEMHLEYQPIVTAESAEIRGFEALLRWSRPGHGLVPPDEFIPTAEDTGMIVDIGAWVLDEACQRGAQLAAAWPDRRLGIAVNVSSRQIADQNFVETVAGALSRSGLDANRLTLELTESTIIEDTVNTQVVLQALRELGINLSLDDFGTGYSSLTYLRSLPINVVKIDKSFVRTLGTEREDTAIVSAVLSLARNLDVVVVAEGVETPEQLAVLLQLDCPYLQGYLFSRPVKGEQLDDLVAAPPLLVRPSDAPA